MRIVRTVLQSIEGHSKTRLDTAAVHVHDTFDYQVADCRVVANPAGYWHSHHGHENKALDPSLILEIESQ